MTEGSWIDPLYRIPIIGNDIYQVGQIYEIIDQSCAPNPIIAARAMFAYSPSLVWMLFKPDIIDLTLDRAGRPHKKRRRRKPLIDEAFQIDRPTKRGVQWAIFQLGDLAQKLGWYVILLDATTDWAVNWTSAAYQFAGCELPEPSYGLLSGPSMLYIEPFVDMPYNLGGTITESKNPCYALQFIIGGNGIGPYSITFSGETNILPYQGRVGVVTDVFVRVWRTAQDWLDITADEGKTNDGNQTWSAAFQVWNTQPKNIFAEVFVTWTDGVCAFTKQSFQIVSGPAQGLIQDP